MPSILKKKNAQRTGEELRLNRRYQWLPHCGAKQRARNLKRLQAEALREQRDRCDWLTETQSIPASAPSPDGP